MKDRNKIISIALFMFFAIMILNAFETNNNPYENFYTKFQKKHISTTYNTKINGTVGLHQEYEVIVGAEKLFFFNYTQADTGEMITNCSIKYCEWYNENNMSQIYNTTLTLTPESLYKLDIDTPNLDIGNYVLVITLGVENHTQRTAIIDLIIKTINTNINDVPNFFEENEIIVGFEKLFFFNYTQADTGEMISNCSLKYCEWYNENNASQIYNTSLTETLEGLYKLDINTSNLEIGNYFLVTTLGIENYTQRTAIIKLSITNLKNIEFIFYHNNYTIASGEVLKIELFLNDAVNKSAIINANVSFQFEGKTYSFIDNYNGNYSILVDNFKVLDYGTPSENYSILLLLQKEYYNNISIELNIMVYLRELDSDLSATNLIGNSIIIDKSEKIFFTIRLDDSINKSKLLNNAYIRLIFDDITYIFQSTGNNSYNLTLSIDNYDTFVNSKNFISHIIIQLQNYERINVYLYIKINIEEYIPGFPMIYFFNL